MNLHTHPAMICYDPGGIHREWPSSEVASQTGRALLNLREMLVREIEPGERISELRGGARRGVSRTPIPVALDCLANQGLLDLAAGGGFVVKEFTLADILGRHRSARVTGGHGGAPHCGRAHSRFVNWTPLRRLRDEGCDSFARYLDLNEPFLRTLVDLANSPMLRWMIKRVLAPRLLPRALGVGRLHAPQGRGGIRVAHEPHPAMVEAIEKRQRTPAESPGPGALPRHNLEAALAG